jgi:hypothetical protein
MIKKAIDIDSLVVAYKQMVDRTVLILQASLAYLQITIPLGTVLFYTSAK